MNAARGTTLVASMFGAAFALLGGILSLGVGSVSFGAPQHADTPREVVVELPPRAVPGERATARALRRATQSFDAGGRARAPKVRAARSRPAEAARVESVRAPVEVPRAAPAAAPADAPSLPAREPQPSPRDDVSRLLPTPAAPPLPRVEDAAPSVPTLPDLPQVILGELPELPAAPELPLP